LDVHKHPYVIITGGPGSGKTTLIEGLRDSGYHCIDEIGRDVIKREVENNSDALPWKNTKKFRDLMFAESITSYNAVTHEGIVFFDRGIIDNIGYSQLIKEPIPKEMDQAARDYKYNAVVFVTPPWQEIYENDAERKQSFEEAVETFDTMVKTYKKYGYQTIILPKDCVHVRIKFILNILNSDLPKSITP